MGRSAVRVTRKVTLYHACLRLRSVCHSHVNMCDARGLHKSNRHSPGNVCLVMPLRPAQMRRKRSGVWRKKAMQECAVKEKSLTWTSPSYCDVRLGFEVTAYIYVR